MSETPDKCPICGAAKVRMKVTHGMPVLVFECDTETNMEGTEGTRSATCYSNEADTLRQRVQELERERSHAWNALDEYGRVNCDIIAAITQAVKECNEYRIEALNLKAELARLKASTVPVHLFVVESASQYTCYVQAAGQHTTNVPSFTRATADEALQAAQAWIAAQHKGEA